MVKWTPNENFFVSQAFMSGSQTPGDRGSPRGVLDTVASWTPLPKDLPRLKLMANYDFGWEEDLATRENGRSDWQGYALYARYELNDKIALNARWEQFWDDQGVRTGLGEDALWEMTYGADYKVYDNLLTRLEYRHDHANTKGFDATTNNTQDTAMASLIYLFA